MKYIQIGEMDSVLKEDVVRVEGKGDISYIYTICGVYETMLPYSTIMKMLESDNPNSKLPPEGVKRWEWQGQHFAG